MPALSPAAPVADARLGQYRAPLQRVAIAKMLHQLSQVGTARCRGWGVSGHSSTDHLPLHLRGCERKNLFAALPCCALPVSNLALFTGSSS